MSGLKMQRHLRRQMFALTHINDIALIKDEFKNPHGPTPFRVEAYDVAHLMGGAMVGVMTVVINGHAQPAEYRKFKINTVTSATTPQRLREILSRRLRHPEWQMPKLIVVDGSTAQLNAAEAVLEEVGVKIPLVGVVKDERHAPSKLKVIRNLLRLANTIFCSQMQRPIALRFRITETSKERRAGLNSTEAPGLITVV